MLIVRPPAHVYAVQNISMITIKLKEKKSEILTQLMTIQFIVHFQNLFTLSSAYQLYIRFQSVSYNFLMEGDS